MQLDYDGLIEFQQVRPPYLMMDCATEIIPGISAKGYKQLTEKDWFFPCHFPTDPVMPGFLQVEALMQMASLAIVTLPENKRRICYLTGANKLVFKRKIIPGDQLDLDTKILSFKRGVGKAHGLGSVKGEFACEAEMDFVVTEILTQYRLTK